MVCEQYYMRFTDQEFGCSLRVEKIYLAIYLTESTQVENLTGK